MKTSVISLLAVFSLLIVLLLPAKSQNKFDPKDKRRVLLIFHFSDTVSPKPYIAVTNGITITSELASASNTTTMDSVFISLKENDEMIKILESYGDTIMAGIPTKKTERIPLYIQMSFKNGKLGFAKNFLKLIVKETNEKPILLIPKELLSTDGIQSLESWLKRE